MVQNVRRIDGRALGHAGYWMAGCVIVGIWLSLFLASRALKESQGFVDTTLQVLSAVSAVNAELSAAEAAQRGFLLAGNAALAQDREAAIDRLFARIGVLRQLIGTRQQARLDELERAARARVDLMHEGERLLRAGREESLPEQTQRGRQASTRFFALTYDIRQQDLELLERQREAQALASQRSDRVLFGSALLFILVLVPAYFGFVRQARAREKVEGKLRDLAENLPGAVFQYRAFPDGTYRYEFLSEAAERLRGIDRKAALANPAVVIETIVEEDRAHVFRQLDLGAQSLQPVEIDYRVRSAHGVRWMRTTALPRKQDGSVLWTGHWNDVTDKVQMQQAIIEARDEAERASDAKSAFLATVSHEIRTPMNGVIGLLELLAMSQLQEEQQNTLDVVRDSARSLLRIIDDILDFSKIDAGKFDLHPEPASVRALVERVRTMYAGNASVKHLVLRSEVDAAIAAAHLMDPLRLGQILNNLVNNAIKFTEHGEVELRAELAARDEGHELIRFVVRDTGPGLGEDEQKRLFMPFTQGATPARVGGTGLGLAISKRLAELMGGELTLQSEPGMGTTLTLAVRLPVCDDRLLKSADPDSQPERLLPRPPPEPARALEERTYLLLVDDHPVNLMLLKRQANALGYAAETVDNASAALDRWSTVRFAAIITDVNMPGMDGCELARRIRSIEEATARPRTPIIACTANALRGEAENCLQAGMDDYLPKPVQLGQLGEKLAYWVPLPDSPIHAKGMNELTEGDASLERRLLELFDEHCIHDLRALEDAFESGDDEELVHAAHRMKGAASTIAAVALARSCEAIELAAREGARARARAHLADVREQLARVRRHVAERVRGAPGRHDARTGGGA